MGCGFVFLCIYIHLYSVVFTVTFFSAPDMRSDRKRRAAPTNIRCRLALVADFRFFNVMGQESEKQTINYMVSQN